MNIFIGGTKSDEIDQIYYELVEPISKYMIENKDRLIYGGGNTGPVGNISQSIRNENGETTVIVPDCYKVNMNNLSVSNIHVTNTVLERTDALIKHAHIALFIPGGTGTQQEFFCAIEIKRAGEFDRPIILLNQHHYYDAMLKQLEKSFQEKFIPSEIKNYYVVKESVEELIEYLKENR